MVVYFIRHGSPEYPQDKLGRLLVYGPSASLSSEGRGRVVQIAQAIQQREGRPFDMLITSPYTRAEETAALIGEVMQLKPQSILEDDRLRDTDSTWPGEPVELFLQAWHERKVFLDPHALETLEELRARMMSVVKEYTERFRGQMIGFVGHGDPFRCWLLPEDQVFGSYADLINATFESVEGIRAILHEDGRIETEIVQDFMGWMEPFEGNA